MNHFLEILKKKVVIFDGSFGALMRQMEIPKEAFLGKEGFTEILCITRPDIISEVTEKYFQAGSDVVQTNTFTGNPLKVMEFGFTREKAYEINVAAAKIAKKAALKYSTGSKPRFVKGSLGPSGFLPSSTDESLNKITYDELKQNYYEQALGLIDGGVDLFIIETQQDILEAKATIAGVRKAMVDRKTKLPIVCQVSLDVNQNMLLGTNIQSVLTTLDCLDVDIIGLNCSTGPKEMTESIRYLCNNTNKFISCIPNAGIPFNEGGKTVYPLRAEEMLEHMKRFVYEFGVNIIGSCCGSNPKFIELMAKEFDNKLPKKRSNLKIYSISSSMAAVSLEQEPRPLIIGETTNATGSRKFLNLLKDENYESIIEMARAQAEGGAHVLDLSTAHNDLEKPEAYYMEKVLKLLANTVQAPLVIDSTDYKIIEAALKDYPGKPMINSINLECNGSKIHNVLKLVKEFGGSVIGMTIDETGMAEQSELKFKIARRLYEIYTEEYKLDPNELFIDALTFPLTTGEEKYKNSAVETLKAVKKIKEKLPGVKTVLGISNVSFGLSRRGRNVLNSMFLYHALRYGLDAAIINSRNIIPYSEISDEEKTLFDNLIFNKTNNALQKVIEFYGNKTFEESPQIKEDENLPVEKKLSDKIILRKYDKLNETIDEAMKKYSPVEIINQILIPAMKEVGDKFGRGEFILPFVLESAGIMKKAVTYLEKFMNKTESYARGKIVLATVYGDVHDIGKNLVKTIVSNNGYEVIDLGKQVPVETIIEKAREIKADAIGLSALLVSTSKQMKLLIEELDRQDLEFPVIIGGASVNSRFGAEISIVNGKKYKGGVFYAKNAFDCLDYIRKLTSHEKHELLSEYMGDRAEHKKKEIISGNGKSGIRPSEEIPKPPFFGIKTLKDIDLKQVYPFLNLEYIYKLHWGIRLSKEEYERHVKESYGKILEDLKHECIEKKWLMPKAVYGFFHCRKKDNSLLVFDKENNILEKFDFPRQHVSPSFCLSDYFHEDRMDLIALQVVTVGSQVSRITDELTNKGEYNKALYLHGLAVETAEAFAEYVNRLIIKELGFPKFQGLRYSFGYPACPDLKDQVKLFKILNAEKLLGLKLTVSYQIDPECSTSAIVVYNKDAKYFSI